MGYYSWHAYIPVYLVLMKIILHEGFKCHNNKVTDLLSHNLADSSFTTNISCLDSLKYSSFPSNISSSNVPNFQHPSISDRPFFIALQVRRAFPFKQQLFFFNLKEYNCIYFYEPFHSRLVYLN